jgi:TatD DNase family protein
VIDFHCHIDLFREPQRIVAECEAQKIYVLSVTTTPKAWRKTAALAKGTKFVRTALGLHPQLAHERSQELPLFEALLDETRYVGEIGLDGSKDFRQNADIQLRVFERILSAAKDHGGRVYTIHSRGAADAVLASLRKHGSAATAVLHWFSGTKKQLAEAVAMGCWFSVGPAMLRSEKGRSLATSMPRDRVLTETDGPFAQVQERPLEPSDVHLAVAHLAELWSVDASEVDQTLRRNLTELLSRVPEPATA